MRKLIKLAGRRFGRLTVTGLDHISAHGAVWQCQCDCGKAHTATGSALRRGTTKSCGCAALIGLTGQRFGRLVVIGLERRDNGAIWRCRCDCGKEHVVRGTSLRAGSTESCGCLLSETARERATRHGQHKTGEYRCWHSMRQRCLNPTDQNYHNYGGRGITICPEWDDPARFLADMGPRPAGGTLERIDNELGYSPENCKWATPREQAANTRRVHNSETGIVGVTRIRNWRYRARIHVEDKQVHLGYFCTPEEAVQARADFLQNLNTVSSARQSEARAATLA